MQLIREGIRMKKIIAILLSATCLFSLSVSVMAEETVSYTFDDETSFATVTNTLASGGNAVLTEGYEGKSLSLDGSYGLYLGDVGNTFSVSAMVKITSAGGTSTIFFKNMGTSSSQKWTGVFSNNGKPAFWTHGDGYAWSTIASGGSAVLNSWANVLYIENNGVGSLYVNDELVGEGNVARGSGQLYLGVTYWSADAVSGLIDNVKLYDYDIMDSVIEVPREVIGDIELKKNIGTESIVWTTSDESVVTSKGKVTRHDVDKTVTLTATLNGETLGEFEVTVLKKPFIVNDKVILSYKFGEADGAIIHDDSGNGNHGAASGGLQIGEEGAVFDGIDDYVTMSEGILYGNDNITIVMKMVPSSAQKHVFAYGFGNTSDTGYMFLNPSCPDTNALRFAAKKNTYAAEKEISSVPGVRLGEEATVTVVINSSYVAMYVDGDLVMDGDIGMTVSDLGKTTSNFIGKSLYDGDPYFAGTVSEFTVYGYCMKEADIKASYGKEPQYKAEEQEEYITAVSFENGIEVELVTYGRSDVKVAAAVLDETGEVVEFSVGASAEELNVTKSGTIIVFAYNEEDNTPGKIYIKGQGVGFEYEYTPGNVKIISDADYKNGMVIVAGFDAAGRLTGVVFKVCNITAGEALDLNGDFENTVTFKMIYLNNLVTMVPVE